MGAWIEIEYEPVGLSLYEMSHPTMGAWIEIKYSFRIGLSSPVAPHDGCVD